MDTRRLISAVLVTLLLVFAWQIGFNWLYDQMGWQKPGQATTQPTTQPAEVDRFDQAALPPATQPGIAPGATQPTTTAPAVTRPAVQVLPPESPSPAVVLGSTERDDSRFRMAVEIVPEGAAVGSVVLNEFTREVGGDEPYVYQRPFGEGDRSARALATRGIVVNGTRVDLDSQPWSLVSSSETSATYAVTLAGAQGQPMLRVLKTYELTERGAAEGAGYEIGFRHAIENLTDRPLDVRLVFNGTLTPPREIDRGPDRYIVGGYEYERRITIDHHAIEEFTADTPTIDITRYEQQPLRWAGTLSVYFAALARPTDGAADQLAHVETLAFNPAAPPYEREAGIVFATEPLNVPAGQSTALPMRVFFGPRQRSLLNEDYYAAHGYNQILVLTGGPCAYCTFQWLINLLVLLLRGFYIVTRDWGLAIIGLVVLVRLLLHPITKKSQISMMKMSKFGPEIERLRKKYGDNKDELNKAMMQFYKEQGFSPVLGCLPMFLQMPIWIALWSALNSTFELRHAPLLYGFTWIDDLSKPDHLIEFSRPFDIWFLHIGGLNLLPILMGVVFYVQMKLQPKPVSMTKEQEQQQKIMMWMMPLLFPIMLYSGPSGLNLYILTSTLIGIWESKRIRDHIKQQEAREAEEKVIIDAKPSRRGKEPKKRPVEEPKRGIAGWLANLQERAEHVRREAERKGK